MGDVMVTKKQLLAYKKDQGFNFNEAVRSIGDHFGGSDYIVANLETPVAGEELGYTNERYLFNTPVEMAMALRKNGVDLVTTANNHCLDRGVEGLSRTIRNLEQCGLCHIGTHKKKEHSYFLIELKGIKVGFLSFTYGTNAFVNGNYLKDSQKYMVDLLQRQELSNAIVRKLWTGKHIFIRAARKAAKLLGMCQFGLPVYERREASRKEISHYKNTIEACRRAGAEYIISCLHIGGQYNEEPTEYTKEICKLSLDLGVNAVIANHEHTIHGIDKKHITGREFCIYSLGNFLSSSGVLEAPYDKMAQYSAVVHIDLTKDGQGKVNAQYAFELFCCVAKEDGKVVSQPFFEYFNQCNEAEKEKIIEEHNALVNKIYQTERQPYPVLKEYKISFQAGL